MPWDETTAARISRSYLSLFYQITPVPLSRRVLTREELSLRSVHDCNLLITLFSKIHEGHCPKSQILLK